LAWAVSEQTNFDNLQQLVFEKSVVLAKFHLYDNRVYQGVDALVAEVFSVHRFVLHFLYAKGQLPALRVTRCESKFDGWLQVLLLSLRLESRNRTERVVFDD
jgi:hypothetical protein